MNFHRTEREDARIRADAERAAAADNRPCPECGAAAGEWCLNPITGQPYRWAPAHWRRLVPPREREDD